MRIEMIYGHDQHGEFGTNLRKEWEGQTEEIEELEIYLEDARFGLNASRALTEQEAREVFEKIEPLIEGVLEGNEVEGDVKGTNTFIYTAQFELTHNGVEIEIEVFFENNPFKRNLLKGAVTAFRYHLPIIART